MLKAPLDSNQTTLRVTTTYYHGLADLGRL